MRQQADLKIYLLHVFALAGFAIAQPLFDLLGNNPDFFIARGSQSSDLVLLAAVLVFGLTILMAGIYLLLAKISTSALKITHLGMLAILVGVIFLPLLKKTDINAGLLLPLAVGVGVLFSIGYYKLYTLRIFVSALSPIVLIFAALFLFGNSAKELRKAVVPNTGTGAGLSTSTTPVVMVVFDEFALTALMDANHDIDKTVFPNFYDLSRNASWYRNATTVATSTMLAVPAIFTGNYPKAFVSQSFLNYPDTLFTMLADSHRMNVYESTTTLCSPELCTESKKLSKSTTERIKLLLADSAAIYLHIIAPASLSDKLPVINMTWEDYWQLGEAASWDRHNYGGRLQQLEYFVDSITNSQPPGLHLVHINFPHVPYQYLPSGKRYQGEWELPGLDFSIDTWGDQPWLITQAYQRFMLQAATADKLLGDLIEHLKSIEMYDEALLIIVADHGLSFSPNSSRRDTPPLSNLETSILPIPLFIKYPYQLTGNVSDENVETIDILPTIADVLGVETKAHMDGRSLIGERPTRTEKLAYHAFDKFLPYRSSTDGEAKYASLKWKLDNFETDAGVSALFNIGQYSELLGSQLEILSIHADEQLQIELDLPELYTNYDPDGGFVPSRISGVLHRQQTQPAAANLAIAVNGVIVAVTQSYQFSSDIHKFSAMVPEQAFKRGFNQVAVLLITADSSGNPALSFDPDQLARSSVTHNSSQWRLKDDRIITANREIPVISGNLKGSLEYARKDNGTLEFFGWAMDIANLDTVAQIMIFEDGRSVYSNTTGMPREEGRLNGAPEVIIIGFQFIIPESLFASPAESDIRLFAISKYGYATELEYYADYDWIRNPATD